MSDAPENREAFAVPLDELEAQTLAHYEDAASALGRWMNTIPRAIREHFARRRADTVTCEDCAFRFGAEHENEGGGYSCPNCAEAALRTQLRDAMQALEEISQWGPPGLGDGGWMDGEWAVQRAERALAAYRETVTELGCTDE